MALSFSSSPDSSPDYFSLLLPIVLPKKGTHYVKGQGQRKAMWSRKLLVLIGPFLSRIQLKIIMKSFWQDKKSTIKG